MAETIPIPIEADVRRLISEWFSEKGYEFPVFLEAEPDMPGRRFMVEKTGSIETNHIYESTLAIQSYAGTMAEAAELNELVKVAARNLIFDSRIISCHIDTDYPFTDLDTQSYRYQAVITIHHY